MSTVEYAVLLALLVGGALLSVDLMGDVSEEQFAGVASTLGGDVADDRRSAGGDSMPTPEALGWTRSGGNSLVPHIRRHGLNAFLLVVLGFAFYRLRRSHRRPTGEPHVLAELEMAAPSPRFVAKRQEIMRKLADDFSRVLISDLLVRDLMTTDVTTVRPDMPIEELAELMKRLQIRHMIVADVKNEVLGVCSDRDLSHKGKRAGDIMTKNPLTVAPDASMRPAMSQMLDRHISSLPVVDGGKLVGIITTTDLVMAFQCVIQVVQSAAADMLHRKTPEEVSA
jgi:acetoin utilization protein AcuB